MCKREFISYIYIYVYMRCSECVWISYVVRLLPSAYMEGRDRAKFWPEPKKGYEFRQKTHISWALFDYHKSKIWWINILMYIQCICVPICHLFQICSMLVWRLFYTLTFINHQQELMTESGFAPLTSGLIDLVATNWVLAAKPTYPFSHKQTHFDAIIADDFWKHMCYMLFYEHHLTSDTWIWNNKLDRHI